MEVSTDLIFMEVQEKSENGLTEKKVVSKKKRKQKGSKWRKSDKLISLIALFISLGTFITFAYQNFLIQKQQYRSVMPYLMINKFTEYDENQQALTLFDIMNNGVGPTFIEDIEIRYEGKVYSSIEDFYLKVFMLALLSKQEEQSYPLDMLFHQVKLSQFCIQMIQLRQKF